MAAPNPQARSQVPADLPGSDIKPCFQRGLAAIRALITVSGPGREPTRQVSRSPGPGVGVPSPELALLSAPQHLRNPWAQC